MKANVIRSMAADARRQELEGLMREQFNLRMQKVTGQLRDSSRLGKIKRDIARLLTIMNEANQQTRPS